MLLAMALPAHDDKALSHSPPTTFSGVTTARDNKSQLPNVRLLLAAGFCFISIHWQLEVAKEAG